MARKHYPVQRIMRMREISPQSNNATMLIRADSALSVVNHRLYRQSRVPKCKVSIDANLPDGVGCDVYVLRDTWMNQKAYQLAKRMFDKNNVEELQMLPNGSKARWNDFRVDIGLSSFAYISPMLEGEGTVSDTGTVGEYVFSEVHDASGNANTFRWLGTGSGTWNIIDEYDVTGNTNSQPTTPTGDVAYSTLEDEIDIGAMDHLQEHGNLPPYAQNIIDNNVLVRVGRLVVDADGTSKLSTGFFNAPCGLIVLEGVGAGTSVTLSGAVTLEVQAGDYKGVNAPSYLE